MAAIALSQLTKVYATGVKTLDALDLSVQDGEFVVLVGPSECGKTTALRMVAGLERITSVTVSLGGQVVNDVSPDAVTSPWSSRTTRSTRTCRCTPTSVSRWKMRRSLRTNGTGGSGPRLGFSASVTCSGASRGSSRAVSGSGWRWAGR